ncbi:MAG: sigma-70 family RNA polymerase sigma factor [Xanthobacteraceae bacterium]
MLDAFIPAAPLARASHSGSEGKLVAAVVGGDKEAAARFVEVASASIWSVVVALEGDGAEAEAAFLDVIVRLKADGYARLRPFDGRSRLATYLALVARDILAERLARRFVEAPGQVWSRFERFFAAEIRRRVQQRFPRDADTGLREDAYQEICLKLIEDNFRRIRAYNGHGSFIGYVLTVVDRLLIDLIRRVVPRRKLPAAIARLPPLEQAVYAAIAWNDCPADSRRVAMALRGRFESEPDLAEVGQAIARTLAAARLEHAAACRTEMVPLDDLDEDGNAFAVADPAPSPEDALLLAEEDAARAALIAAVQEAAAALPPEERLYLQILFTASEPSPAREIARRMGCPVEHVYRLKQRAQRWLADIASMLEKKGAGPSNLRKSG